MELVFEGDCIRNIILHLTPKSLYQMRQVRQLYRTLVTKSVVYRSVEHAILRELRLRLCDKYDGFVEMCKKVKAKIIGSFIVQCMNNEDCSRDQIVLCIPNYESIGDPSYDTTSLKNFMDCARNYREFTSHDDVHDGVHSTVWVNTNEVDFDECRVRIFDFCNQEMSITHFVVNYYDCDVNKNIYDFDSGKLYIHKMNDIFAKCVSVAQFEYKRAYLPKICRQGFKFYDETRETISNFDVIAYLNNVVKIKKYHSGHIVSGNKYFAKDDAIYHIDNEMFCDSPVFQIVETISQLHPKFKYFVMEKCGRDCNTRYLCPELDHIHGAHVYSDDGKACDTEIIFILTR